MAYTYLVGWRQHDLWYYGVRFARNCKPEDLWTKYFTSSKKVKQLRREIGEPDVVEVRKVFSDPESARRWETRVIKRMKMCESSRWLNQTDNTDKFYHEGERGKFSEEHRRKLSEAAKKRIRTPEHIAALHAGRRGKKNSEEHKLAVSRAMKGYSHTEQSRENFRKGRSKISPERLSAIGSAAGKASAAKYKDDPEMQRARSERMTLWWKERKSAGGNN